MKKELHKPIIKKIEKRKVHSSFIDNICGTDLVDMQPLSKFDKGIRFLLSVVHIFSEYAWVIPLKYKKGIEISNTFQNIIVESGHKPNKKWVDKGSE